MIAKCPSLLFRTFIGIIIAGCAAVWAGAAPARRRTASPSATDDFLLDGQRFQIRCGEIHFARVPREYWRHRLRLCKAMGLNTVCAYLFWNMHEPDRASSTGPARRMPPSSAASRRRRVCG